MSNKKKNTKENEEVKNTEKGLNALNEAKTTPQKPVRSPEKEASEPEVAKDEELREAPRTGGGVDPSARISEKLNSSESTEEESDVLKTQPSSPFDIMNLTPEQRRALKAQLDVTPDQPGDEKKVTPRVRLRRVEGKVVRDHGRVNDEGKFISENSYRKLVRDPESGLEREATVIDIGFFDGTVQTLLYRDFINSEQVSCDVVESWDKEEKIETGETTSRETGRLVTMQQVFVRTTYKVKLPDGDVVEIPGRLVNA